MFALSAGLLWRHVYVWKSIQSGNFPESDRKFFYRQHRRRVRTTGLMGTVAICLGVGPFITNAIAALVFWIAVTLLVFGICCLALLDLMSTRSYLEEARKNQLRERGKLEAEIRKLRSADRNGDE